MFSNENKVFKIDSHITPSHINPSKWLLKSPGVICESLQCHFKRIRFNTGILRDHAKVPHKELVSTLRGLGTVQHIEGLNQVDKIMRWLNTPAELQADDLKKALHEALKISADDSVSIKTKQIIEECELGLETKRV